MVEHMVGTIWMKLQNSWWAVRSWKNWTFTPQFSNKFWEQSRCLRLQVSIENFQITERKLLGQFVPSNATPARFDVELAEFLPTQASSLIALEINFPTKRLTKAAYKTIVEELKCLTSLKIHRMALSDIDLNFKHKCNPSVRNLTIERGGGSLTEITNVILHNFPMVRSLNVVISPDLAVNKILFRNVESLTISKILIHRNSCTMLIDILLKKPFLRTWSWNNKANHWSAFW